MDDEIEVGLERDDNPLPQPLEAGHPMSHGCVEGRVHAPHHERAHDPDALERPAHDAGPESFEIDHDIRQLRHGRKLPLTWSREPAVTSRHSDGATEGRIRMSQHEIATLAGGCFWCLEAAFSDLKGVERVQSGYSGGHVPNPSYEHVCTGDTGHAEVVQITFDPAVISFAD